MATTTKIYLWVEIMKVFNLGAKLRENRGQNRVRISDPFLGPFSIGTLSTGSKNGVPFLGPRFGFTAVRGCAACEIPW